MCQLQLKGSNSKHLWGKDGPEHMFRNAAGHHLRHEPVPMTSPIEMSLLIQELENKCVFMISRKHFPVPLVITSFQIT